MKAPDGTPIYRAECNYDNNTMADCFKEANKTCPLGIIVIKYNESFTPTVSTLANFNTNGGTNYNGNTFYPYNNWNVNASSNYNTFGTGNAVYGKIMYRELIYGGKIEPQK